ncbi:hypothetical protein [Micavibrio aeruginosavorus]|uniref:hypothetical protein n=1 Tax=Micavibrio aeruginosavorus TaxID=349221 RepID=UPI003F4AB188
MCKFHKTVAREIATNPVNGIFDPARYAVALVALSTFRIEQAMPSMFGCDGYSKYEMATDKARIAVANSNMNWHHGTKEADMETLRRAMDIASYKHNLSIKGLNLPKNPVNDTAFLDEATVKLYEGYTAPGYAAIPLSLKTQAHKPEFEPIRAAVETFMQNPVTFKALARRFENTTLQIFADAHQSAHPALVGVYERIPGGVRNAFKSCAMCVGGGAGGAAVSHVGCIAIPAIAAASGTAVSAGAMAGLMMMTAPVIAVAVTYGIDKWRGAKASALKLGCSAALAFGIAAGMSLMGGHDNHGGGEHDHQNHDNHHQHHQPMQNPGLPADEWKKLTDKSTMCLSPRT